MTLALGMRIIAWLLSVVCIVLWIRFAIRKPELNYIAFAIVGWCAHMTLFYLIVTLGVLPPSLLNTWSGLIRIHALLLLITGAITMGEKHG